MIPERERFNPFPGLRSFEPEEEYLFFGRELQVDELLKRLTNTRFLPVLGTSGSGKSSLVRSGLIPALESGFMVEAGSRWQIGVFRPGNDPIGNLAEALNDSLGLGTDADAEGVNRALIQTTLLRGAKGLVEAVKHARLPPRHNLLIIVDQFEELFRFKRRQTSSYDEASAFMKLLLKGAAQREVPIYVVLTMRSDFLGACTEFPGLTEAINRESYLVPRMTRDQLRMAITGPVAVGGAAIAPRLVTRLLNDVGDDPDQLPILQHALMRTWDRWTQDQAQNDPLDLKHYEAIGTMREALSRHAEETYRTLENERLKACVEKMFEALTEKGEEGHETRRPTAIKDICSITGYAEAEVIRVAEHFRLPGRSFLMPAVEVPLNGESILDISHESLMRNWTRLKQWVEQEAQSAQLYMRLTRAAERYREGTLGLWRDPELQFALKWKRDRRPTVAWAGRYDPAFEEAMGFLELSRSERDRHVVDKARRQKKRLRQAQAFAALIGVAAVLILIFGIFAMKARGRAEEKEAQALAAAKIAEAERNEAHKQRAIALEQSRIAREEKEKAELARMEMEQQRENARANARQANRAKSQAEQERREAQRQKNFAEQKEREALIAKEMAQKAERDALHSRDQASENLARALESEEETTKLLIQELAHRLATRASHLEDPELIALAAIQAYRLNFENGGYARSPLIHDALQSAFAGLHPSNDQASKGHREGIRALALSPSGRFLVSGGDDGTLRQWEIDGGNSHLILHELDNPVRSVAMSEDHYLAAGTLDGRIYLWNRKETVTPSRVLADHSASINDLAFHDGNDILVSASSDGTIKLWDLRNPSRTPSILDTGGKRWCLAISGDLLATGGMDGVRLWKLGETDMIRVFALEGEVRSLAFSEDDRHLAAGTLGGMIYLWRLNDPNARPTRLPGHLSRVNALIFKGDLLVSAGSDGKIQIRPYQDAGREPVVLRGHSTWVWTAAFTREGDRLFSGDAEGNLRSWFVQPDHLVEKMCMQLHRNMTSEEWRKHVSPDLRYQKSCPELPGPESPPAPPGENP